MTLFRLLYFSILLIGSSTLFADCQGERVKVQVLGSGGPELSDGRASSSYLVWLDNKGIILVDAGPGSSLNYEKSGANLLDLQLVAFTHFHVDHSADFPAFIKAFYFARRDQDLMVLGPEGNDFMPATTEFIQRLFAQQGVFPYLSEYVDAQQASRYKLRGKNVILAKHKKQTVYTGKGFSMVATPVHHGPIPALAWRINLAGCAITFSGDMSIRFHTLTDLAKGSDLFIAHHAIPEAQQGVARSLHLPPSEISRVAQQAAVKKLILSHRMKRTLGREQETLGIIKKYYQGPVVFAEDIDSF